MYSQEGFELNNNMKYQLDDGTHNDIENQKYLANASTQAKTNLDEET